MLSKMRNCHVSYVPTPRSICSTLLSAAAQPQTKPEHCQLLNSNSATSTGSQAVRAGPGPQATNKQVDILIFEKYL